MSHNKLNDILAAYSDIIRSQQTPGSEHEPTSTEFFVLILKMLSLGGNVDNNVVDQLRLLTAILPHSSKIIVRDQFKLLLTSISKILHASQDDSTVVLLIVKIIGGMIAALDISKDVWTSVHSLQAVNILLSRIDDPRPLIRKKSHEIIEMSLKNTKEGKNRTLGSYIGEFCYEVIRSCSRFDYKRSLHVILFLESSLANLPNDFAIKIFDAALKLQDCELPILTAAVLRMADAFFQNSRLSLNSVQVSNCLNSLLSCPPSTADMEANSYYCTAISSGFVCLNRMDKRSSFTFLRPILLSLIRCCESEFTQIHIALSSSLKRIIAIAIGNDIIHSLIRTIQEDGGQSSTSDDNSAKDVLAFLNLSETLLQLRYQYAWLYLLDVIRSLFEIMKGEEAAIILKPFVIRMADIYQSIEGGVISIHNEVIAKLLDTLGISLRSLGVIPFLKLIPFSSGISNDKVAVDPSREWVINLLHSNLKYMSCRIAEFGASVLSTAQQCNQIVANPIKFSVTTNEAKIAKTRVIQLWSLLPEFCYNYVSDLPESFLKIAKILEGVMKDASYPELFLIPVTAFAHIAKNVKEKFELKPLSPILDQSEGNISLHCLQQYAPSLFTLLFGFVESMEISDHRFQPIIHCVTYWISISPSSLVTSVAKKILQILLTLTHSTTTSNETHSDSAAGWIMIMQAIIPYLNEQMILLLFKSIRPLLAASESLSLQKRAYSLLESLLLSHNQIIHSVESRGDILSVICDSILVCHVSARHMRLRCLDTLVGAMTNEEVTNTAQSITGEVLICQKDANKKSREAAVKLLRSIVKRVDTSIMLLQFCCAILGETATMRASGVIGLCILILEHRFDMVLMNRIIEIFPSVCLLLQQQCVEQTRAVLSFVRVCASVFEIDLLQSFLPQLIKAFTEDVGTLKGKFSFRIRAILRKLVDRIGEEPLEPFLSESDKALLGYICKQKRRLKKKRELKVHDMVEKLLDSDDDDSSDEENDMDVAETIGGSSEKYNHEDPRLLSRPKATRVKDTMNSFPSSLEDLLEDQAPSFQRHHRATDPIVMSKIKRKVNEIETNDTAPSGDANGDDNEIYDVIFSPNDGKIIIQEKSQDKSNDTTDKKSRKFSSEAVAAASHAIQNKKQKLYGKLPGEEYRSKKAGGDMWKKGMLEPHAFVPLDPRLLSKKNHAEAMVKFGAFSGTNKTKSSNLKKTSGFRNRDVVGNRKQKKSHQAHHKNN